MKGENKMNHTNNFYRFEGRLWESLEFLPISGWETEYIAKRQKKGDGQYILEIYDDKDNAIITVNPYVDFEEGCTSQNDTMRSVRLISHIPAIKNGRRLVFRTKNKIIYETKIAKEPPEIKINEVKKIDNNSVSFKWEAHHQENMSLSYSIVYIVDKKRVFLLERSFKKQSYTAKLNKYPGGNNCQLAVLVSDGVRSTFAVSKRFSRTSANPKVWIQSPSDNDILPFGQSISLIGQATDITGASLIDKNLIWTIDDKEVVRGIRLTAVDLKPGTHKILLEYAVNKKIVAAQAINIKVKEMNKFQKTYLELLDI